MKLLRNISELSSQSLREIEGYTGYKVSEDVVQGKGCWYGNRTGLTESETGKKAKNT